MKSRICFLGFFSILLNAPSSSIAYPQIEFQSCVNNAITAVATKGVKATLPQIKNYCDCSLKMVIDESKDINQSLAYCNGKFIQNYR
jgi:hypothetical protein